MRTMWAARHAVPSFLSLYLGNFLGTVRVSHVYVGIRHPQGGGVIRAADRSALKMRVAGGSDAGICGETDGRSIPDRKALT